MTAWAEVIGDPVAHSLSPVIHRFWLDALNLPGAYHATAVGAEDLASFLDERRKDPDWRGCNVTMPHKHAVLALAEDRGGLRDSIGAANTLFRADDGALVATNTDAAGFYEPIADADLAGRTVTVAGAGGAARAVLFALRQMGVGEVVLLNRTPLKAAALLHHFGLKGRVLGLDAVPPPSALIVNASALGMAGQPDWRPDLSQQDDGCIVYDLVYHPLETPLLQAAAEAELATVDGLDMLIGQARVAFELFFGQAPPEEDDEALRARLVA
jgi:shikimate dehydrogenase